MGIKSRSVVLLSEMINNQEGDFFALMTGKLLNKTKEGKPFFKVTFRDAKGEAQSAIWSDSPFFLSCRDTWQIGKYYKIRGVFKVTDYGPQVLIQRIREARESDIADGFSKSLCRPSSESDPSILYNEVLSLAKRHLPKGSPFLSLITRVFKEYREKILDLASSRELHHAYAGGFLEHTLSVATIAVFLSDHFSRSYPDSSKRFSKDLVVAGSILHEIGKLEAMSSDTITPSHSLSGDLIGYPVLGRDILRRFSSDVGLSDGDRLALEHILLSHPGHSDWGAAISPSSLESLIVYLADHSDSLFATSLRVLSTDPSDAFFTARNGPLGAPLLKKRPEVDNATDAKAGTTNVTKKEKEDF